MTNTGLWFHVPYFLLGDLLRKATRIDVHIVKRNRVMRMTTDKSCWTYKSVGNWTADTFVQDFTCTWFPKHGKGDAKKLWPQKEPDEGCQFWEKRGSGSHGKLIG